MTDAIHLLFLFFLNRAWKAFTLAVKTSTDENDYISYMFILDSIKARSTDFSKLCKTYNVTKVYAFGSATTDHFGADSDVDLLIEIEEKDPLQRGEKLLEVWQKLEEFFQRKVDLLTESSLRNPVLRKNINATKVLVYDGKRQEVPF